MFATVTLAAQNGTARWAKIEANHPAGLGEAAIALTTARTRMPMCGYRVAAAG